MTDDNELKRMHAWRVAEKRYTVVCIDAKDKSVVWRKEGIFNLQWAIDIICKEMPTNLGRYIFSIEETVK